MNESNTTRRLLTALTVGLALTLTACGSGGSDGGGVSSVLPGGAVGTVGDGINTAEYNAIKGGMTADQIKAIVGDAPSSEGPTGMAWNFAGNRQAAVLLANGVSVRKVLLIDGGKTKVDDTTF